MTRKHPDRPLYVNIPRDLDKQPAYRALSRDAQWLLQHLERDPFRLGCGVFQLNVMAVAKSAKAEAGDVMTWFAELVGAGWILEDDESGEVWLTQHIEWDFPLATPNQAKGLLRDVKRVNSEAFGRSIVQMVLAKYPDLAEGYGIDPDWIRPSEGPSEQSGEGPPEGVPATLPVPKSPKQEPEARIPENEERSAAASKPGAGSRKTAAAARGTEDDADAECTTCEDLGILGDDSHPCTDCDRGRAVAAQLSEV